MLVGLDSQPFGRETRRRDGHARGHRLDDLHAHARADPERDHEDGRFRHLLRHGGYVREHVHADPIRGTPQRRGGILPHDAKPGAGHPRLHDGPALEHEPDRAVHVRSPGEGSREKDDRRLARMGLAVAREVHADGKRLDARPRREGGQLLRLLGLHREHEGGFLRERRLRLS